MLETAFARPPGDVGNSASWPFPVLFETVRGAFARRTVSGDVDVAAFAAAGRRLASRGAVALVTSCGFLAAHQAELADAVDVPVAASALLLVPLVLRCLPRGQRVGVITYDAASLGPAHFAGVGADPATPVAGLPPDGRFRALIEGGAAYDAPALEAEALDAAMRLCAAHAGIGAIVLECTNLPPFSAAIRRVTGLPVHDALTLGRWLHAGATGSGLA